MNDSGAPHEAIDNVVREINRCNQRGGRMLSVVDLIGAGTLPLDLAAYLSSEVYSGTSFLVGALPGGAGKSAVMGALLACAPRGCRLIPTDDPQELSSPPTCTPDSPRCYVCHEIGDGPYYAYLWGSDARAFFGLPRVGHQIATNLHADTYEQCRAQLCAENGVPPDLFQSVRIHIYLRVRFAIRGYERSVATVWAGNGDEPHQLVYAAGGSTPSISQDDPAISKARRTLEELCSGGHRRIDAFRTEWLRAHADAGIVP